MSSSNILVRAAISDGSGRTRVEQRPLAADVSRLRVESSAVCGTDVMLHDHGLKRPAVLGHHTIGRVEYLTPADASALGVAVGTRVAVEEYVGCGDCVECRDGRYRFCPSVDLWTGGERVGMIPADRGTGLHGGNAEYMELTSQHILHPVPEHLSVDEAAWILPLANAVDWTLDAGRVGPGSKVAVVGPGYHGLSCVSAALTAGAERVIALGLTSDAGRLALAEALGATGEFNDDTVIQRVREKHGPLDAVVDTIGTPETMTTAVGLLGRFGVLVVAGLSGGDTALDPTVIARNLLTVRGVRGRSPRAVRTAVELLGSGTTGLERIPTHSVRLDDVGQMLRDMSRGKSPITPHVVVDPWLRPDHTQAQPTPESLEATR